MHPRRIEKDPDFNATVNGVATLCTPHQSLPK